MSGKHFTLGDIDYWMELHNFSRDERDKFAPTVLRYANALPNPSCWSFSVFHADGERKGVRIRIYGGIRSVGK